MEAEPSPGALARKVRLWLTVGGSHEVWIGFALSVAVALAWVIEQLVPDRPAYAQIFAPNGLPLVAAGFAAVGMWPLEGSPGWIRLQRALRWTGLLLMVWAANGWPLDVFRVVGLIPLGVDWPGLVTRSLALASALVLLQRVLGRAAPGSAPPSAWYGYAAFVLALPYPILRTDWALGGTLGLQWAGAAGVGWEPWLFSIPWLAAAGLSLFLVSPPHWMPRRLLLVGGWSATAIVAMIGPSACWVLITSMVSGGISGPGGIEFWVPVIFYSSWLLWAIFAGAATHSYQLRSAGLRLSTST